MSKVFVLDTEKRPLNPIHSAQARQLLRNQKAAVFRRFPFTIILKESRADSPVSALRLKIDPGAKTTGIALVNDASGTENSVKQALKRIFRKIEVSSRAELVARIFSTAKLLKSN